MKALYHLAKIHVLGDACRFSQPSGHSDKAFGSGAIRRRWRIFFNDRRAHFAEPVNVLDSLRICIRHGLRAAGGDYRYRYAEFKRKAGYRSSPIIVVVPRVVFIQREP
ncbi:MAG: hypothetical protein OXC72_11975 [Roseovarius sp.]|nr:hypothetical protein [Roseovarius sp.]